MVKNSNVHVTFGHKCQKWWKTKMWMGSVCVSIEMVRIEWIPAKHTRKWFLFLFSVWNPDRNGSERVVYNNILILNMFQRRRAVEKLGRNGDASVCVASLQSCNCLGWVGRGKNGGKGWAERPPSLALCCLKTWAEAMVAAICANPSIVFSDDTSWLCVFSSYHD